MIRLAASVLPAPDSPLRKVNMWNCAEGAESLPDDDTLVVLVALHVVEGSFGDGEYVRGHLQAIASSVGVEHGLGVDAEITEGIDTDKDMANVRLWDDEQG
jgi:hypothetical protein